MVSRLTDLVMEETKKLRAATQGAHVAPSQGRLVLIGPTSHEDGQPMEISELPANTPMFVGWCNSPEFGELLSGLQEGNPPPARALRHVSRRAPRSLSPEACA